MSPPVIFFGEDVRVENEDPADKKARKKSRQEHPAYGDVHDQTIEYHRNGRRDQDTQGTCGSQKAGAEFIAVPAFDKGGHHYASDGDHRGWT